MILPCTLTTVSVSILKKGQIAFYGTIMQAIEKSGCEKFEDAYLTLAGEEVDAE